MNHDFVPAGWGPGDGEPDVASTASASSGCRVRTDFSSSTSLGSARVGRPGRAAGSDTGSIIHNDGCGVRAAAGWYGEGRCAF